MGNAHRRLLLSAFFLLAAAVDRSLAGFFDSPAPGPAAGEDGEDKKCSQTCESEHCTEAPLMRYGKYCGVSYTGCSGEAPCDALDACCMLHDACVEATDDDYFNMLCNQSLLDCVATVKEGSRAITTFAGNKCNVTDVADEITSLVEAAVFAKRILHRP